MEKLFKGYSKREVYLLFGSGICLLLFSFFGVTTTSDGETLPRGFVAVMGVLALLLGVLAYYFYDDPKKMELDFFTPDEELHEKICRKCALIRHECKKSNRSIAMFCTFAIVSNIFIEFRMTVNFAAVVENPVKELLVWCGLPGIVSAIIALVIWNALNNAKMAGIVNGEYQVAEATEAQTYITQGHDAKYRVVYHYFALLEDVFGVKGHFVLTEDTYAGMREGSTVYVVKLNRGGLFRNYMEPIV